MKRFGKPKPMPVNTPANKIAAGALTILTTMLAATPALAHHPLGGATPDTIWAGLLSGIGHPIIGLDHFAFVLAVGILAAQKVFTQKTAQKKFATQNPKTFSVMLLPALFILGTCGGTLLHVYGAGIPFGEAAIALSVMCIGVAVMATMRRMLPAVFIAPLLAIAGVLHGHAYGAAVAGAEPTPIIAYVTGFAAIQMVLSCFAAIASGFCLGTHNRFALAPRFAGAMIAGIGAAGFAGIAETALFPIA